MEAIRLSIFTRVFSPSIVDVPEPLDLVVIFGTSSSTPMIAYAEQKLFVLNMLAILDYARLGIIQYGLTVNIVSHLGDLNTMEQVKEAIDGIAPSTGRQLAVALNLALNNVFLVSNGARPTSQKSLLVFTDEAGDIPINEISGIGKAFMEMGVNVVVIAFTGDGERARLSLLACRQQAMFFPEHFHSMHQLQSDVLVQLLPGSLRLL